ncbi:MAG TPA: sugar transferase [Candidatus Saccharimonadales bacterium]|nr:sugar transferase [Candidatus Saccharimonadales bacterium]
MKSNASLIYSFVLVVGDFLALVAAFVFAYLIRGHLTNIPVAHPIAGSEYLRIFALLLPFWILFFALLGLYSSSIQEKRFPELGRLFIGSFVGLLFVIAYGYAFNKIVFPARLVPVYGFSLAFIFLAVFRNLARESRAYLFKYDVGITNILIVGNTKIARELVENLADHHISGYRIVGVVGNKSHAPERSPHLPVFDTFDEAVAKLRADDIHSIVQTELYANQDKNNEILEFAQTHHISYRFIPGNSEMFVGNIEVELFRSQIPVIAVHQTALIGWGRVVKRFTDLILGGSLLIIALPFMLIIAVAEKLSDIKAPILYKEIRLTRFGTKIRIMKFRSMNRHYTGMSPEEAFTKMGRLELINEYRKGGDQLPNDPRITRMGRLLRGSSLDELPQLFNVVKGDISLVGPRALYAPELEKHDKKDLILAVKSGLTGLAQVSGRRNISFEERRKIDLYYVQNWSLWLDLIILIKTIRVVLGRIGAK